MKRFESGTEDFPPMEKMNFFDELSNLRPDSKVFVEFREKGREWSETLTVRDLLEMKRVVTENKGLEVMGWTEIEE